MVTKRCPVTSIDLVVGMERAEWDEIARLTEIMGMEKQKLFQLYKEAMKWTKEVMVDTTMQNESSVCFAAYKRDWDILDYLVKKCMRTNILYFSKS